MNLGQLNALFRRLADDVEAPFFISDDDFTTYINEAEVEACRRARLLVDSTSALTALPIVSGQATYNLDSRILYVRRVKLASSTTPLAAADHRDMDQSLHGWDSQSGTVERWITGMDNAYQRVLRLYRIPTASDTATLTVVRKPENSMESESDEPEIEERFHIHLLHWPLYRYYSIQDADVADSKKAQENLEQFVATFGTPEQADEAEAAALERLANRFAYATGTF
jgi:hypothetical protein